MNRDIISEFVKSQKSLLKDFYPTSNLIYDWAINKKDGNIVLETEGSVETNDGHIYYTAEYKISKTNSGKDYRSFDIRYLLESGGGNGVVVCDVINWVGDVVTTNEILIDSSNILPITKFVFSDYKQKMDVILRLMKK